MSAERKQQQATESPDTEEIGRLQRELTQMNERHRVLCALVPQIPECTGIIMEMISLEAKINKANKRLTELRNLIQAT